MFLLLAFANNLLAQTTVKIGSQTWMTENLDVSVFQNGDTIPQAQTDQEWTTAGFNQKPAWCYVVVLENDKEKMLSKYKKLYNSFAINDPRGIAPSGWRISTTSDWMKLMEFSKMKNEPLNSFMSSSDWQKQTGTNKFGLDIKPGGWRDVGCGGVGTSVTYWCEKDSGSLNEAPPSTFTVSVLQNEDGNIDFRQSSTSWIMGHYVRCIKIE